MKRDEYLSRLRLSLSQDGFEQVEEAIAYFDDLLQDRMADEGLDEEAATATLEAPESAAKKLGEGFRREEERVQAEKTGPREEAAQRQEPRTRQLNLDPDQVRSILIRDRNMGLEVLGEDRSDIQLSYTQSEKVRYTFSLQEGALALRREEISLSLQMLFPEFLPAHMRKVVLRLPLDLAASLDLKTSNGSLSLLGLSCWGNIQAVSSNARLSASDLSARQISLNTSNASIHLENLVSKTSIKAQSSNGRLKAKGLEAKEQLILKTSNASLSVEGIHSPAITLQTSNGKIDGTLPGQMADYAITSGTSNGKNSLPQHQQGGAWQLGVHTSNAGIHLGFEVDQAPKGQGQQAGQPFSQDSRAKPGFGELEGWAQAVGDKARQIGQQVAQNKDQWMDQAQAKVDQAMDRLDSFEAGLDDKINQHALSLEEWGDQVARKFMGKAQGLENLGERITRAVEDAIARAFEEAPGPDAPDAKAQEGDHHSQDGGEAKDQS